VTFFQPGTSPSGLDTEMMNDAADWLDGRRRSP
jgi:hypothetical protein